MNQRSCTNGVKKQFQISHWKHHRRHHYFGREKKEQRYHHAQIEVQSN